MNNITKSFSYRYTERLTTIGSKFTLGKPTELPEYQTQMLFVPFSSDAVFECSPTHTDAFIHNDHIPENFSFEYPLFVSSQKKQHNEVILLLHGLNERSWHKYLPWAEYLCHATGKAVLLFPIAYHMNRSPQSWTNPRFLQQIIDFRKQLFGNDRSLSFANVALSERLSNKPERFYLSGQQSFVDVEKLIQLIRSGSHPYLSSDARIDIFAYSIGALLAQVMMMSDEKALFSESKLFLFCGGCIFDRMYGQSRSIMDRFSFEKMLAFYKSEQWLTPQHEENDITRKAFNTMLSVNIRKEERHQFFIHMQKRLSGVCLALDKVMPYQGIVEALGSTSASKQLRITDLPFEYTHENPFPLKKDEQAKEVNAAFLNVFEQASAFFIQ